MHIFPRLAVAPPDASQWGDDAAVLRRLQGDLAHQALALLEPGETKAEAVLRRLRQAQALLGLGPGRVEIKPLADSIMRTLHHPDIAPFFDADVLTLPEQEVVVPGTSSSDPHKLLRIDRVVLLPDGALWVLDFKLGPGDPGRDKDQVRDYQRLMAGIFQRPCHGAVIRLDRAEMLDLPLCGKPLSGEPPLPPVYEPKSAAHHKAATSSALQTSAASPRPIQVFPLHADLTARLQTELLLHHNPINPLRLANVEVIFPHRRPKIHLHHGLAKAIQTPFLPPRCQSLEDWMLRQACLSLSSPPALASSLDQAFLLHGLQENINARQPVQANPSTWEQFLPWGLRLALVMDELDRELVTARNLPLPPDDLPPLAQDMLARLGALQEGFHAALATKNLTTKALLAKNVAPDRLCLDDVMYVCGLFALTRSEATLIETLWRSGARLWWQANRPLPDPLERWAKAWQARMEWMDDSEERSAANQAQQSKSAGKTAFVLAHDLHSQLRQLASDAASWNPQEKIAVILPDSSLLRPLLAHLPTAGAPGQVNVTLGLPLERTTLGALLHVLAGAATSRQASGVGPKALEFLEFWQNPWVRRLLPEGMITWLRQTLASTVKNSLDQEDIALLSGQSRERFGLEGNTSYRYPELAGLFFEALDLASLSALCAYLKRLLTALRVLEMAHIPLEMHAVHALYARIIPQMEYALSNAHSLPSGSLWKIFWTYLRAERVPFSGEPLTPWQVMGLLESRLLCFDKVVILECLEGTLPAAQIPNPLLPDALRPALGLPQSHAEEQIVRYHMERLLASAREVRLYSRQGLAANPLEGRKTPSRYWEQALWQEEKAQGTRLGEQIARIPLDLHLGLPAANFPEKEHLLPLLHKRLATGLALSALNTYLACPVRFFYEHVARFSPRPGQRQDPGALAMGELAHKVLETLFRPVLNQRVVPKDLLPQLTQIWDECVANGLRGVPLSPASRFFHVRLLHELLTNYLRKASDPVCPVLIEEPFQRKLPKKAEAILLRGRLDRVDQDQHSQLPLILDYKTGPAPLKQSLPVQRLWDLNEALQNAPLDRASLILVKEQLQDLQLPAYLYLFDRPALCGFWQLGEWDPEKAFVHLYKPGKQDERQGNLEDFLHWQKQGLPALLEWIGRHVLEAPLFYPACLAQSCGYCPWNYACPWAEIG